MKQRILLLLSFIISVNAYSAFPKLLPVPLVRQVTDYSCGAASLLSVLYYYNLALDYVEIDLHKPLHTSKKEGTRPQFLVLGAQKFGLSAVLKENMTSEEIKTAIDSEAPVIVDYQAWRDNPSLTWEKTIEDGHYSVIVGYDAKNFYLMDPVIAGTYGYVPIKEFETRWHDYETVNGKKVFTNKLGIVVWGKAHRKTLLDNLVKIE